MHDATLLTLVRVSLLGGMALWTSLELLNNTLARKSAVATVARLMSMESLLEPPVVMTPLLRRRVSNPSWHRLVHVVLSVILLLAALLLWIACVSWVAVLMAAVGSHVARGWSNLAVSVFIGMGFFLTLGGLWFGYWIRQATLQVTHLLLICVGSLAALLVNATTV